jgi:hypothetical protein
MKDRSLGHLAVIGVSAALLVLFAGGGAALAAGEPLPAEFWAAATSLSGALVGLLAPQPATKGTLQRRAADLNRQAASAAADETVPAERRRSLADAADASSKAAADPHVKPYDLRIVLLSGVGAVGFVAGTVLAFQVGDVAVASAYDTAVKNAADTLIALASGAAGAVVGMLAPAPGPTDG